MSTGSWIAVPVGLLVLVLGKVCLDLASKEVQGWLPDLPFAVLRVARRRLPAELRVPRHDEEFVPELKYILFDEYKNKPIAGLLKGLRFALGHVRGAKRLARESGVKRGRRILRDEFLTGTFRLPARWEPVARRALDLVVAMMVLPVVAIPMLLIAMAIRVESPGPALHRQQPLGRGGRPFTMYKFRTMRVGGSDVQDRQLLARELRGEDTSVRGSRNIDSDPRMTRIGSIIRRTSIDQLPQLINVLRGQMALVGPRPCLRWEAEMFPARFAGRFDVPPGLTGLWQVSDRSTMGTLEMLELDLAYVRGWSFWTDLMILLRTIPTLLRSHSRR